VAKPGILIGKIGVVVRVGYNSSLAVLLLTHANERIEILLQGTLQNREEGN